MDEDKSITIPRYSLVTSGSCSGNLYAIKCGEFVKIGFSNDVAKRFAGLQASCPYPMQLLGVYPKKADRFIEKRMHMKWHKLHHYNEWFKLTEELSIWIKKEFTVC